MALFKPKLKGSLALLAKYGIRPRGIVHVGANTGQEFEQYQHVPFALYIEPIPEVFAELQRRLTKPDHVAVQALCSDVEEDAVLNVASNDGKSSSMLAFGRHATVYPEITYTRALRMKTRLLDRILSEYSCPADFMVLDVQGAELKVLRGTTGHLPQFRAIYTEVSETPLYAGGCTLAQIIDFLEPFGFRMEHVEIGPKTWGDALFVKYP